MKQVKWFERNFNFSIAENIFPSILERLSGTPARLEEKCRPIPANYLTVSIDKTWTVKENIGHLADLESLWQGRLEDIVNENPEMRVTDLQNNKTDLADHNETPLEQLLAEFRQLRLQTLTMLDKIDDTDFSKSSLHPRLKKPMGITGLLLFVAEHDDHHLARITELIKIIKK